MRKHTFNIPGDNIGIYNELGSITSGPSIRTVEVQEDNNFPVLSLFTGPQLSKKTVKNVISFAIRVYLGLSEANDELIGCCNFFLIIRFPSNFLSLI